MRLEERRAAWNERAAVALQAPRAALPSAVLAHALQARWTPRTPRAAVDGFWRAHPLRADRLARALAAMSGAPADWRWTLADARATGLRVPPLPYRLPKQEAQPGRCVVCGQPVFRLGWHRDRWSAGVVNQRAAWHACCVVAWKLWNAPSEQRRLLARVQRHRCAISDKRLLRTAEVDHRVPLYEVWRDRRDLPWPELLGYWGAPNLQVVNRVVHTAKSVAETQERARRRRDVPAPDPA
ncbi:hypothetical protein [Hansschlegelia sp.]|uniref:hypothetical protein n=1 Tax=Hansschlegelia sp. TaxID=2041892 RepID=UPI002BE15E7B|nr:hypothetical protein [Hansschlegelia sp.]HVI28996.1 hypothetical protein [Hansschlegelia sp.]